MITALSNRIPPRLRRNFLAVADQGIFALSNFVLVLYLSRHMPTEDFGAYSFALSIFFLTTALHNSVLVEPMLVYGANRYREQLGTYLDKLITVGNSAFSAFVLAAFLAASAALHAIGQNNIADAFIGIGLAAPFSFLAALIRRTCNLRGLTHIAVLGGVLYLAVLVGSLVALSHYDLMTLTLAAAPMGLAGAAFSAFAMIFIPAAANAPDAPVPTDIVRQHGRYARWAIASETVHWMASNLAIVLLPLWYGPNASATFRVVSLLYMPLYQAVAALAATVVPLLSSSRGTASFAPLASRTTLAFLGLGLAYAAVITLVAGNILEFVYGDRYRISAGWAASLAAIGVFFSLAHAQFSALRALERPDAVLLAYAGLCLVLIGSVPFYPAYGLSAAFAGLGAAWAAACGVNAAMLARITGRSPRSNGAKAPPLPMIKL